MAVDNKTLAFVNFYAAIGTLEKFVEYDEEAKEIAKSQNVTVRFHVKGGPDGLVIFKDGKVSVIPYDHRRVNIHLYCPSTENFNKVVDGTAMPIPVKGLFKTLKFMGSKTSPFTRLTDKMSAIMRAKEFSSKEERDLCTILSFYAMAAGICEVGNHDEIASYAMNRVLDGKIVLGIKDVCYATIIKKNGALSVVREGLEGGRAFMTFGDIDIAKGLIDGELDSMACVSSGKLETCGHMLMLENINKILNIVPKYLQQEKEMTYKYPNNVEMMNRAGKVIPSGVYGHLGPAEGCMIPSSAYPFFVSKAKGSEMWDVDGNRFIDYMCGYGPNVSGYCDPDVDSAALEQIKKGNCTTLPSHVMVEFAELLTATVKKDWAFFCKNGGDVTSFAIMISRYYTGKKKIIFVNNYYHGVAPWTQKPDTPGTLIDDCKNSLYVDFNDLEGLKKVIEENKDDIACFIGTPYMHGNFVDNVLPKEGYWQGVRKLCTDNGIILIIDDIRAGFRLSLAGSDNYFGFEADLITFCKALANGYNVSALCGKEFLKSAASTVPYTGSYWMSAVPFAAGIANINKLIANDAPAYFKAMGERLTSGLLKTANELNVPLIVSGPPALFYLRIADTDGSFLHHQEWIAECVKRGVFITNHHNHFTNLSLTPELVDETIEICSEAMSVYVKNHPEIYRQILL